MAHDGKLITYSFLSHSISLSLLLPYLSLSTKPPRIYRWVLYRVIIRNTLTVAYRKWFSLIMPLPRHPWKRILNNGIVHPDERRDIPGWNTRLKPTDISSIFRIRSANNAVRELKRSEFPVLPGPSMMFFAW